MKDQVEMVDGRVYSTTDGWETVYVSQRGGKKRKVTDKDEADLARYLAIAQSSASASF